LAVPGQPALCADREVWIADGAGGDGRGAGVAVTIAGRAGDDDYEEVSRDFIPR
jgi:hypothetical protein